MLAHVQKPLDDAQYIVFDIETTGGNPEKNGITEIFAIRYARGEVLSTFYSLVNPEIPIPPIVRRMTGIDNKMVRGAPRIQEVMPDFVQFIGNDILVSHNTIGDMKFIRYFAKETTGIELGNFYLCTHLLVEKLAPEAPDKSLRGLAEFFRLAKGELHRAEADAYVTLDLFKVLVGRLKDRAVQRVDEAVRLQGDLESGMRLGWGVQEIPELSSKPGVFSLHDHEGKTLFVSSAVQLDREVLKLKALDQLPRQLLRLVLKAYAIKVGPSANLFDAMLSECEAKAALELGFPPENWHQRVIQTLFVAKDPGGIRLGLGPVEAGTLHAFGPIRDRRVATEFLDAVAAAFDSKVGRRGLVLPAKAEETLVPFLTGQGTELLHATLQEKKSWRLWFRAKDRQRLTRQSTILKRLLELPKPPKLVSLLNLNGHFILPDLLRGGRIKYRVTQSRPEAVYLFGDNDTVPAEHSSRKIGRDEGALTVQDAARVNATLWWIYNARSDGRFVSDQGI